MNFKTFQYFLSLYSTFKNPNSFILHNIIVLKAINKTEKDGLPLILLVESPNSLP